jgi:hypothetical protein
LYAPKGSELLCRPISNCIRTPEMLLSQAVNEHISNHLLMQIQHCVMWLDVR